MCVCLVFVCLVWRVVACRGQNLRPPAPKARFRIGASLPVRPHRSQNVRTSNSKSRYPKVPFHIGAKKWTSRTKSRYAIVPLLPVRSQKSQQVRTSHTKSKGMQWAFPLPVRPHSSQKVKTSHTKFRYSIVFIPFICLLNQ